MLIIRLLAPFRLPSIHTPIYDISLFCAEIPLPCQAPGHNSLLSQLRLTITTGYATRVAMPDIPRGRYGLPATHNHQAMARHGHVR